MRKNVPYILIPDETASNRGKAIIFKKGVDLKNNVVYATNNEWKILEEYKDLEAEVVESINPVKTTKISREEDNAKHNRYRDIGKQQTFLALSGAQGVTPSICLSLCAAQVCLKH